MQNMTEAEDGWKAYFAEEGRVKAREVKYWVRESVGPLTSLTTGEMSGFRPVVAGPKGLSEVGSGSGYLGSIQGDPGEGLMEEFREQAREMELERLRRKKEDLDNDIEYCESKSGDHCRHAQDQQRRAVKHIGQAVELDQHAAERVEELEEIERRIAELDPEIEVRDEEDKDDAYEPIDLSAPQAEDAGLEDEEGEEPDKSLRLLIAQHLQGCLGAYGAPPLEDKRFSMTWSGGSTYTVTFHHRKGLEERERQAMEAVESHLAVELVPDFQSRNGR